MNFEENFRGEQFGKTADVRWIETNTKGKYVYKIKELENNNEDYEEHEEEDSWGDYYSQFD